MMKTILAAATAALALTPAAVMASDSREFSHEGTNYAYTTEQKGDVTVIKGRTSAGEPFHLVLKGNRITGTFGNNAVSFTKAEAARNGLTRAD